MAEGIRGAKYDHDLFDMSFKWFGNMKGSLAMVAIVVGALFASLCGSSVAGAVTVGVLTIPKMLEHGYDKRLAAGAVTAAGGLAHMIPPSLMAIVYASIAETSVGAQLMAGLLPGIVLTFTFGIVTHIYAGKTLEKNYHIAIEKFSWQERFISLGRTAPAIVLGLSVIGAIYFGVTTPTEAAALGATISLGMMIKRSGLNLKSLIDILLRAVKTTCFLMAIVFSGTLFSFLLSYLGVPQKFMQTIAGLTVSPWMILIAIQLIYIFLGCFLEGAAMLILTLPVLLPIITDLGFDPVWFGVLFLLNLEIALITPPVGIVLYAVKGIAPDEVSIGDIFMGSVPYFGAKVITLILVMIFPQIALWVPTLMSPG
jgi:tripartite ATP-independent transporter DctM subunit